MWPYYRVSTGQQDRFGFSIESQRPAVRGHVANNSGVVIAEFSEVMSGRRDNIFHERDVGDRWRELFSGLSSEPGTPSLRR
jgi:hypothetical protein